jgi:hypothetical protein
MKIFEKYGLNPFGNFALLGFTSLFCLHQFLQKVLNIPLPIMDNYFDMLAFGFLLPFLFRVEKIYRSQLPQPLELSPLELSGIFLLGLIFSEILFPKLSPKFTADPWDALPYLLGILLFALGQKSSSNRNLP